jgi:hypothetical protein
MGAKTIGPSPMSDVRCPLSVAVNNTRAFVDNSAVIHTRMFMLC